MATVDSQLPELAAVPTTKIIRTPTSKACLNFVSNANDIRDFYSLHQEAKKVNVKAIYKKLHVANKAVLVLVAALWEAYCEDVAEEGLHLLVQHAPSWESLPRPLLKSVAKELRRLDEEFAPWSLAGEGWRQYLTDRLALLGQKRNYSFATPKSKNVDTLFLESIGIVRISDSWSLPQGADWARSELDRFIDQRNMIAHRYVPGDIVAKRHVREFFNLVAGLVARTDAEVGRVVAEVTGRNRWVEASIPSPRGSG
ncbi:hypothetical protein MCAG_04969 [Micromonospora sp. ATCC 39149]|uniref:RiboL-PSP-HEPN domain-containing protein n=1 Tax=Micromonospora carbonacea TaxID=47853 RepID=A0A7D5YAL2_9ACTN|nr:HEPN domain-containing protein [Micromonospora sp. ATCC 39149]EEP74642.1 hypothetical protein MCAG_04969 [Micromonospora sp. ATCC 39149]QLK00460.1 hypothetical protein HZU44_10670 [Micromonospora carbonacea]